MKSGRGEIRRLLVGLRLVRSLHIDERHTLLLWAAVCGVLGALAALLFKAATVWLMHVFTGESGGFVAAFASIPPWQRLVVPAFGALVCGVILQLSQSVIKGVRADYMEAIALGDGVVRVRTTRLRSLAALFAISGGESIGREGPLVQVAALAGSLWGRLRHMSAARLRVMVACGAAAGLAAAYHSPLGGAFFVAEFVIGSIAMETLGPLLIASTVSALTVQVVEGFDPLYLYPHFTRCGPWDIGAYALAGVAMGLGSIAWMRLLDASRPAFSRLKVPLWARLFIGGILIGLIAVRYPEVCGNGKSLIQSILADHYALGALAILVFFKIVATCISFGSGAIGGVFTPSLLVGAALGFIFAAVLNLAGAGIVPGDMALISMGAFLAAAASAPVTAILMIFEMSMQYNVVIPLMVSTVIAYATARSLSRKSLYSDSIMQGARGVLDRPIGRISVGDLMRANPRCVAPMATFGEVARAFLGDPRREVWVASEAGFAGCVKLDEVGPFLDDADSAAAVVAADILSADVPRLATDMPAAEAFKQFSATSFSRLPVIDEKGAIVGEVSRADLFLTISEIARRG